MKRLICCGDRHYAHYRIIYKALSGEKGEIESVVEGEARGADTLARTASNILGITVHKFPAKWKEFGQSAGPIRNQEMLEKLEEFDGEKEVWAFHTRLGESTGTKDMMKRALKAGIIVRHYYSGESPIFTLTSLEDLVE